MTISKYEILVIKSPPQPAYSLDVAPNDFYLFGYLEEKLKWYSYIDTDELFENIIIILNSISHNERKSVFDLWIDRCKWTIDYNGDYYIKKTTNNIKMASYPAATYIIWGNFSITFSKIAGFIGNVCCEIPKKELKYVCTIPLRRHQFTHNSSSLKLIWIMGKHFGTPGIGRMMMKLDF